MAEQAGTHLCLAACSVGLAITVAAKMASKWFGANGSSEEDTMESKSVRRKMVRSSFFGVIEETGTAAVGGLLAT